MRLHMSSQIGTIRKRSRAYITLKRLLTRMSPHMTLQQPRTTKTFTTYFTLTRKRMSPYMHFERAQRRICFLTIFTRKMFKHLSATMKLFMVGQASKG